MKAFLLGAGLGTRLLPLTEKTPKCLLPVGRTPILQIWLELCRRYGIDEILINVHRHGDIVRRFAAEHSDGLKIRIFEEQALLGSAGTVLANQDWISKEEAFWVFYSDVLTTANLGEMLAFHNSRRQVATIGVCEVAEPSRCGIVQVDDRGIVCRFIEKPREPVGNLAFSGLMIGAPALLGFIPQRYPVDFGFDVLPQIVMQTAAYRINEFLSDIGTLEAYRIAQTAWPGISQSQIRE